MTLDPELFCPWCGQPWNAVAWVDGGALRVYTCGTHGTSRVRA